MRGRGRQLREAPLALLAELTHRCPLRCPYCSNPLEMVRASAERSTADWCRVLAEAAALGVLHVHFSGGEPVLRRDLEELVSFAEARGLYSNLITSGIGLDRRRLDALARGGLQHIQVSLQDDRVEEADRVAGGRGLHIRKLEALSAIRERGIALTLNVVLHRGNLGRVRQLVELARGAGAGRLELAHVQYHGWALKNRRGLMASPAEIEEVVATIESLAVELRGELVIDHVLPDYLSDRPKACMGGWARRFIVVDPCGRILPCHHAAGLPDARPPTIDEHPLAAAWHESALFNRFRGTDWMPQPCRSCPERARDYAGCRCQAFALTGDAAATDPACALAPSHHVVREQRIERGPAPEPIHRANPGRGAPAER